MVTIYSSNAIPNATALTDGLEIKAASQASAG
jgi:hypothetical protein